MPNIGTIEPDNRFFNIARRRCFRMAGAASAEDFFWPVKVWQYGLDLLARMDHGKDAFGHKNSLFGSGHDADTPWASMVAGVSTLVMEKVGEQVAEDYATQKGIKGFLKRNGIKMSNKAIGKAGGKAAKLGLPIHAAFSVWSDMEEYNT